VKRGTLPTTARERAEDLIAQVEDSVLVSKNEFVAVIKLLLAELDTREAQA